MLLYNQRQCIIIEPLFIERLQYLMQLNYSIWGEETSPSIVLLHGLFGMSDNLATLAKYLSEDFYVVAPDLINHGHSPHRVLMDYPSMADDVNALLSGLGIHQFHLLGHSMGGKVAMQMAEISPSSIKGMILADIAPVIYEPWHNGIIQQMKQVSVENLTLRKDVDLLLAEKISEVSLRQFFMKNMNRDEDGFWRWRFGLKEITAAYPDLCLAPSISKAFAGPVLFIKGELSDYIMPDYQAAILKYYPNAVLKIVQGAGHWLHAEKPLLFNRLVQRFLLQDR